MKYVSVTIDVEAQPARAEAEHVQRLIYGQFGAERYGLLEIMQAAERHAYTCTCFLDYPEACLWGESISRAAKDIISAGHDLQLHIHPEFLSREVLQDMGIPRPRGMDACSAEQADKIVAWAVEQHVNVSGSAPLAFRGGGYRINEAVLDSLIKNNVLISSNINSAKQEASKNLPAEPFYWENGVLEFPISTVSMSDKFVMANFNIKRLGSLARFENFLSALTEQAAGKDIFLVFVLHSWALLRMNDSGHYESCGRDELDRLDSYLATLQRVGFKDLPMRDVPSLIQSGLMAGQETHNTYSYREPIV